jgi:hypothetical protein
LLAACRVDTECAGRFVCLAVGDVDETTGEVSSIDGHCSAPCDDRRDCPFVENQCGQEPVDSKVCDEWGWRGRDQSNGLPHTRDAGVGDAGDASGELPQAPETDATGTILDGGEAMVVDGVVYDKVGFCTYEPRSCPIY